MIKEQQHFTEKMITSYGLVDISFLNNKQIGFIQKINIIGKLNTNKFDQFEFKYLYPAHAVKFEKEEFSENGNLYNKNLTESIQETLNKYDVIIVNSKEKKDILRNYIKCSAFIIDISKVYNDEYTTDSESSGEE